MDNKKTLLIVERISSDLVRTSSKDSDVIYLEGIFTEFKIRNRNGRIYEATDFIPKMNELLPKVENHTLLGELDHPTNFDISLKNVSHVVEKLEYDKTNDRVIGKVRLLNTEAGRQAQALIRDGIPLHISSRAAGQIDPQSGRVTLEKLFTYDLVADPGFENAELKRVNEAYGYGNFNDVFIYECDENIENKNINNKMELNEQNVNQKDFQTYTRYISGVLDEMKNSINDIRKKVSINERKSNNNDTQKISKYLDYLAESVEQLYKNNDSKKAITLEKEISKIKKHNDYLVEQVQKIANHNDYITDNLNTIVNYTNYLGENLTQTSDYSEYLGEQINNNFKHNDYLAEQVQKIANHNDYLAEQLGKNCNHNDYLAEKLEKVGKHNDYLAEQLEKNCNHNDYLAEKLENVGKHNDYLAEQLENVGNFSNYLSESLEKTSNESENKINVISKFGDYLAEKLENNFKHNDYLAEQLENVVKDNKSNISSLNESYLSNSNINLSNSNTKKTSTKRSSNDYYMSSINEKLDKIINAPVVTVKEDNFLNFLSEGRRKEFNSLDEKTKSLITEAMNAASVKNEAQANIVWKSVYESKKGLDLIENMPYHLKEKWNVLNDKRKKEILNEAKFYNLKTTNDIEYFWSTRDMRNDVIIVERVDTDSAKQWNTNNKQNEHISNVLNKLNRNMRGY